MNSFKENDKKMDFLDKNRDIQYSDKQTTYDKNKNAVKFTGDIFSRVPVVGWIFNKTASSAEDLIDKISENHMQEYIELKKIDEIDLFKKRHNLTDTDIEMFEKRLQKEENEKRLKEQQMDKNITSPTSSLTKPVMLASSNSVATDGFVDYGVSNDAFSTLQIANDKFIVTRADINESLEDIFSIECFAYINLVKNPLYENLESIYNDNAQTGIYRYLDKGMKLSIKRPSSTNKSIIPSNNGSDYIYFSGIVSDVEYLGVDDDSSTNIDKKYFFKFKLTSSLYRLSINRANRIYTDQCVI